MQRVIIVSNRLPVTAKLEDEKVSVSPSMGGLATGLEPVRHKYPSAWVGWPGDTATWEDSAKDELCQKLGDHGCVPVHLTAAEVRGFYLEFSNASIWPLYHSLPSLMPLQVQGWDEYQKVNERFAAAVAEVYQPGDLIWVHDFQLSLVPQLLRERLPEAKIGFFLHIPFPPSEVFRILPGREELLRGMLGADVVGFHTTNYAANFATSIERVLDLPAKHGVVSVPQAGSERVVQFGTFPLGVDVEAFEAAADASTIDASLSVMRQACPDVKLMLAVDRLDYTKGIPRRLLAFECLLENQPELRGKVHLIQVAVPSRTEVLAYEENKRAVDEIVGRINGRFGAPGYHPIHYFASSFSRKELIHLYRGVDVMVVTPLRDGMNLVAKEFCASRIDDHGVLVLSEFAGAADEMEEALIVNPFDLQSTAAAYAAAIQMPRDQIHERMHALRARIKLVDHKAWASSFLGAMNNPVAAPASSPTTKHRRLSAVPAEGPEQRGFSAARVLA